MDFAGAPVQESLDMIAVFTHFMQGRPPQSVLLLTDVTGAEYDPSVARQWKEARVRCDAAVRASAVYGLKGLVGVAVKGFIEARRILGLSAANEPKVFSSPAEARDWLGQQ